MSSFTKAKKDKNNNDKSSIIPNRLSHNGVKPWIHSNSGIVSTGNREFDNILGGGQVISTSLLINCDNYSNYGQTLLLYQISEAISTQHDVIIIGNNDIIQSLPFNSNYHSSNELNNDIKSNNSNTKSNELNIAWQYEKYLKKDDDIYNNDIKRSNDLKGIYCCSYDLSRRLQSDIIHLNLITVIDYKSQIINKTNYSFDDITTYIINQLESRINDKTKIYRVFLSNLEDIIEFNEFSIKPSNRSILQFLLLLQQLVNKSSNITLSITLHNSLITPSISPSVNNIVDTSIVIESFIGRNNNVPYEFKEYNGFFIINKLQQLGVFAPHRPPYSRYGIKRNHRKLCIEPLHLPPEESRAFGNAGTDQQLTNKSIDNQITNNITTIKSSNNKIELGFEDPEKVKIQVKDVNQVNDKKKSLSDALAAARTMRENSKNKSSSNLSPGTICQANMTSSKPYDF